jgi:hypothetical protein
VHNPASDPDWCPTAVDGAHEAAFDGELVVFVEPTSQVHRITGLAAAAWLLCDGVTALPAMADELANTLGTDRSAIADELPGALQTLRDAGLLAGGAEPMPADDVPADTPDDGVIWPIAEP